MLESLNELIIYGFNQNANWIKYFTGSAAYTMICISFFTSSYIPQIFLAALCCAIFFSLCEYFIKGKEKIKKTYGSVKVFLFDSFGDTTAVFLGALLISIL